jgi:signal recognition particle subunit SRP54
MGPVGRLLKMIPGLTYDLPEEFMGQAEDRLDKWQVMIQSMTEEEKENPKILNSSRIRRVAHGSGTSEKEVKELIKQYSLMKKMMRNMRRKRFSFLGKRFQTTK